MTKPSLFIACDHAGFPLKTFLIEQFPDINWIDLGTKSTASVDYPDFAHKLCLEVLKDTMSRGVLVCGSGQGMAISANRHNGIRAALAWDIPSVTLSRTHNDTNVLCLGSRLLPFGLALDMLKVWLVTSFAGGHHQIRTKKMDC